MNSALIGFWMVLTAQLGGQDITANLNMLSLQINDDGYSVVMKGQVVDAGKLEFKGASDLDIIGLIGANRGKTLKCIYKMDGENVVICYNMDENGERPTDFISPQGTKLLLVTYQKKQ